MANFKKKPQAPKEDEKPAESVQGKSSVVLVWNFPRVRLIHVPVATDRTNGRAVSKAIRLNPGSNQISAESWEVLKTNKKVIKQLQKGELRLVRDQEDKPLQKVPRNLEKIESDEAIVLVENTMEESLLQAWAKGETREEVSKAIKLQLEKLANVEPEQD